MLPLHLCCPSNRSSSRGNTDSPRKGSFARFWCFARKLWRWSSHSTILCSCGGFAEMKRDCWNPSFGEEMHLSRKMGFVSSTGFCAVFPLSYKGFSSLIFPLLLFFFHTKDPFVFLYLVLTNGFYFIGFPWWFSCQILYFCTFLSYLCTEFFFSIISFFQ